jgi:hypothetical protein
MSLVNLVQTNLVNEFETLPDPAKLTVLALASMEKYEGSWDNKLGEYEFHLDSCVDAAITCLKASSDYRTPVRLLVRTAWNDTNDWAHATTRTLSSGFIGAVCQLMVVAKPRPLETKSASNWVRACQACGHKNERCTRPPPSGDLPLAFTERKCSKCKSPALDFGKLVEGN